MELRRSLEGLLRKERDTAQMYLDIAGVIMLALDDKGRVLLVNRMGSQVVGCPVEEIVGKKWCESFVKPADREFVTTMFDRGMAGESGPSELHEYHVITKAGTERLVAWHSTPTTDEHGRPTGTLSSGKDITERRQVEEERENLRVQLAQARKMEAIGTLSAGIAHDFNNLLQIIHGYSELLMARFKEKDPDYYSCLNIMKASRMGAELVQKLLAHNVKKSARMPSLDLNKAIKRITGMLSLTLPKTVRTELRLADCPVMIVADTSLIDKIIVNLATNAAEAMPEGGRLTIDVGLVVLDEAFCKGHPGSRPGRHAVVTVSDTGHGMDNAKLERIFEPYFTSKRWDSTKGRGLGLSTVHGIVERLGGRITCHSAPGEGAVFRVYLPSADVPEMARDHKEENRVILR